MVPFNVGEPARNERTYGLLVSGNYFSGARADGRPPGGFFRQTRSSRPAASRWSWCRTTAGADAFRRPGGGDRPDPPRQRPRPADHRRRPGAFPGHGARLSSICGSRRRWRRRCSPDRASSMARGVRGYSVLGRLAAGATQAAGAGELETVMRELAPAYPESNGSIRARCCRSGRRRAARSDDHRCARHPAGRHAAAAPGGVRQHREPGAGARQHAPARDRRPAGARRRPWRIVRLLLTENVLLALLGGRRSAPRSPPGARMRMRAVPFIGAFPVRFQTRVDALGLAVRRRCSALGCGAAVRRCAGAAARRRRSAARAAHRRAGTVAQPPAQRADGACEVALALMVLLVAGLFLRSFIETRGHDPGFRRDGVLLAAYDLTRARHERRRGRATFAAPAARAACARCPASSRRRSRRRCRSTSTACRCASFTLEGHAGPTAQPERRPDQHRHARLLRDMGIPIVAGVDFADFADADGAARR